VSRPLTFSGSFAASVAPSQASRGRLGADSVPAEARRAGAGRAAAAGAVRARAAVVRLVAWEALFAEPRAGRFAGDRLGCVPAPAAGERGAAGLFAVRAVAARRRSLSRCGRLLGSLLMMSGALVLGLFGPCSAAGLGACVCCSSPAAIVRADCS